ncbi:hypothetical protein ASPWEDRAFT_45931 [Aspergillus wentii DTO 134E9]|uniref:Phosphoglycerate mutase n=1 Tax=Aspergillus wentii DTO 134E9 TaxID=1073089 RepID=A0A1L9R619_ASPWE|nr:uncharacterized protein ASPWEDRAFT_45931 [Aspergillus wentii DTO 134E9]KAI9925147.1 hypothetical protein MW887_006067 [Aspergillus wentii]OJJ30366.1 hypothetical protein ASPWEDRAFT_45931 [Aspergillus wentii DTO 134E9]
MSARIFLIRHGETDWSLGGKHTSYSDIPLSKAGEKQVEDTRNLVIGEGKLIDPRTISRIYVSAKQRTRRTVEILGLGVHNHQHFYDRATQSTQTTAIAPTKGQVAEATIQVTPWLQEWDYGEYEGMTISDVHRVRNQQGLDKDRQWSIWEDGCPGGESPQQVSDRLDNLIHEIRSVIESTAASWPGGQVVAHAAEEPRDVVCIGHGHILAGLALRWAGQPLRNGMRLLMEPGGVAVLGFEHDDLKQPAILLGRRLLR